jgi:hypothetical protein
MRKQSQGICSIKGKTPPSIRKNIGLALDINRSQKVTS